MVLDWQLAREVAGRVAGSDLILPSWSQFDDASPLARQAPPDVLCDQTRTAPIPAYTPESARYRGISRYHRTAERMRGPSEGSPVPPPFRRLPRNQPGTGEFSGTIAQRNQCVNTRSVPVPPPFRRILRNQPGTGESPGTTQTGRSQGWKTSRKSSLATWPRYSPLPT